MNDTQLTHFFLHLTRRQREVLELASDGYSNREIASRLFVEPCVVASHLTNIYGEMASRLLPLDATANRYTLIRLFTPFFIAHPELRSSNQAHR